MLKKTPLFEIHRSLNAKMVAFTGFEMPLQYGGIKEEHLGVRSNAGIFDVSHMGEVLIQGERALEVVQELTVNDVGKLKAGQSQYTVMCRPSGGIIDDLLIYALSNKEFLLVLNASNIEKDIQWITEVNQKRANVSNLSDEIALIALQGPNAVQIMTSITRDKPDEIPLFEFRTMNIADYENILVSATGYTGEKGFELYCNIRHVNVCDLWKTIMEEGREAGLLPCGLAARDTLRLEAGLPLYGNDLSEETTPLEAGLGWLVKWDKGDFIGKEALMNQKEKKIDRRLSGMVMQESGPIPRKGYRIATKGGQEIGKITSGGLSFISNKGIAMGYVSTEHAEAGNIVNIQIRNKEYPAEIVKLPFYRRKK